MNETSSLRASNIGAWQVNQRSAQLQTKPKQNLLPKGLKSWLISGQYRGPIPLIPGYNLHCQTWLLLNLARSPGNIQGEVWGESFPYLQLMGLNLHNSFAEPVRTLWPWLFAYLNLQIILLWVSLTLLIWSAKPFEIGLLSPIQIVVWGFPLIKVCMTFGVSTRSVAKG